MGKQISISKSKKISKPDTAIKIDQEIDRADRYFRINDSQSFSSMKIYELYIHKFLKDQTFIKKIEIINEQTEFIPRNTNKITQFLARKILHHRYVYLTMENNTNNSKIQWRIDWFLEGMTIQDSNVFDENENMIEVHKNSKGKQQSECDVGTLNWHEFFEFLFKICLIKQNISSRNCKHISKEIYDQISNKIVNYTIKFNQEELCSCIQSNNVADIQSKINEILGTRNLKVKDVQVIEKELDTTAFYDMINSHSNEDNEHMELRASSIAHYLDFDSVVVKPQKNSKNKNIKSFNMNDNVSEQYARRKLMGAKKMRSIRVHLENDMVLNIEEQEDEWELNIENGEQLRSTSTSASTVLVKHQDVQDHLDTVLNNAITARMYTNDLNQSSFMDSSYVNSVNDSYISDSSGDVGQVGFSCNGNGSVFNKFINNNDEYVVFQSDKMQSGIHELQFKVDSLKSKDFGDSGLSLGITSKDVQCRLDPGDLMERSVFLGKFGCSKHKQVLRNNFYKPKVGDVIIMNINMKEKKATICVQFNEIMCIDLKFITSYSRVVLVNFQKSNVIEYLDQRKL